AAPAFAEPRAPRAAAAPGQPPLLALTAVNKHYRLPRVRGQADRFQALADVSFKVCAGQTLGIVGESGSGKSTALRIALRLEKADSGRIEFAEQDVTDFGWRQFRPLRRRMQLVQQNPFAALDPRLSIFDSIVEPLVSFGLARGAELDRAARELIERVHLPAHFLDRLPRELSGGQRQRVAIARALALQPDLLLLDEPVSALDVSVQRQILDLLDELQRELGIAYVIVSHDLAVIANVADEVLVMRQGRIVDHGPTAQLFNHPGNAYTQALLDAVPGKRQRVLA
ncbi:ABC transporter ATP-binding protein, partial [Pseudomonas sp. CFBP 13602]|uniref:ABC transporter ATP-binding protein n=1 Tax=Pseudomonas sp. CFBP 13602 TaxID=2774039 RepID=UPI00177D564B